VKRIDISGRLAKLSTLLRDEGMVAGNDRGMA